MSLGWIQSAFLVCLVVISAGAEGKSKHSKSSSAKTEDSEKKDKSCGGENLVPFKKFMELRSAKILDPQEKELLRSRTAKVVGIARPESGFNTLDLSPHNHEKNAYDPATIPNLLLGLSGKQDGKQGFPLRANHQLNIGLTQISVDQFALQPLDSLASIMMVFDPSSPPPPAWQETRKPGAPYPDPTYFNHAYQKFSELATVSDGVNNHTLENCGFKLEGDQAIYRDKSFTKTEVIAELKTALAGVNPENLEIIRLAANDKRPSNLNPGVKSFGVLLALCPTLNVSMGYNQLLYGNYKGEDKKGRARAWTPKDPVHLNYFGSDANRAPRLCEKKLTEP